MVRKITDQTHLLFDGDRIKWQWTDSELELFRQMWNDGEHISDIAKVCGTDQRSIALLIIDQNCKKNIKPRKNGLFGN